MPLSPSRRWRAAAVAVTLVAACAEQPTSPTADSPQLQPRFASASGDGKPEQIPNGVKYRDTGVPNATGRAGSATLTTRALLGKDGNTDLEMTTGELDSNASPPGNLSKLQIKLFAPDGQLQQTLNYNNLSAGGYALRTYPARARHSAIQVQANVEGIDRNRTGVITLEEIVKLRPDLSAVDLIAPEKARVRTPVNITAVVNELNGDVGARGHCVLYVEGAEADRAAGIWVDAAGTVSCAFTHTFETTGTKALEVQVEGVVPGDYDLANNAVAGSIEIVSDNTFYYQAFGGSYTTKYRFAQAYDWDTRASRGHEEQSVDYSAAYQNDYVFAWMPKHSAFPLKRLRLGKTTGAIELHAASYAEIPADWSYSNGIAPVSCAARGSGAIVVWFTICSVRHPDGQAWTWFSYYRNAGDVTYHSKGYSTGWYKSSGTGWYYSWNYDVQHAWGGFVDYGADLSSSVSYTDAHGTAYGTTPKVTLFPMEFAWDVPWQCRYWTFSDGWVRYCYMSKGWRKGVEGATSGRPDGT